jgi:hypothetical protein
MSNIPLTETFKEQMTAYLINAGTTRPFEIKSVERESLVGRYYVHCTVKVADSNIPIDNLEGECNMTAVVSIESFQRYKDDQIKWIQEIKA